MIMRLMTLTVVAVGAAVACFIAGVAGTWLADREPPQTVVGVEILTPIVPPGGQLQVRYKVARYRSCGIHVDRILRDSSGNRKVLDDVDFRGSLEPAGSDTITATIEVPPSFQPGTARYVTLTQYNCNLVHLFWPISDHAREIIFQISDGIN